MIRLIITCQGTPAERPTMTLERCRSFLPVVPQWTPLTQLIDPDAAINDAYLLGWSRTPGGRDLCPDCTTSQRTLAALAAITALPLAATFPPEEQS